MSCERLCEVDTLPLLRSVLANPEQQCFVPLVVGPRPTDMRFLRIGAPSRQQHDHICMLIGSADSLDDLVENTRGILEPSPLSTGVQRDEGTPRTASLTH